MIPNSGIEDSDYTVNVWLKEFEIKEIEYSDFWNDEESEKKKPWYILNGNFKRMEEFLEETGLKQSVMRSVEMAREHGVKIQGVGLDLAAGTCWAVPILFNHNSIEKIYCVEYSQHRLLKIGPRLLSHYGIPKEKVELCVGSFYDVRLPDASVNFVNLVQALHHAADPVRLLQEIWRVLIPGGAVLVSGEEVLPDLTFSKRVKHFVKWWIPWVLPHNFQKLLFPEFTPSGKMLLRDRDFRVSEEDEAGDHSYFHNEYIAMFNAVGFSALEGDNQFVLLKKDRKP